MKSLRTFRRSIGSLMVVLMLSWQIGQPLRAATLYWDSDALGANGVQEGAGSWTPASTATLYNGSTDIAGTITDIVQFGNGGTLAAPANILISTGTVGGLIFGATSTSGYSLIGSSNGQVLTLGTNGILVNAGAQATTIGNATSLSLALAGAQTWNNAGTTLLTIAGGIDNGSNLLSVGGYSTGGITIAGVIGTGGTVTGGLTTFSTNTVTLSRANLYTGTTTVGTGSTLKLDFSASGAPSTNIINNSTNSSDLKLSGGTLNLTGLSGATNSQQFNGVTVNSGASAFTTTQNGATSLSASLGAITRNTGGTLNFTLPTTGSITLANSNDASGILGTWATVGGNAYATVSGGAVAAYAGATATTAGFANVSSATTNYSFAAAATLGGSATANTLQYTGGTATLALGSNVLTLNGLLNTSGAVLTISGAGTLAIGASNELVIAGPNSVTISSAITGASKNLTYSGAATLTLNTTVSTFTGTTTVNSGTLTLALANVLNVGSSIVINGGTLGQSTFAQSVAGLSLRNGSLTGTTGLVTSASAFDLQNGSITSALAGLAGADKTTLGTVTITNTTASTLTGGFRIKNGTLIANSATPLGAAANAVTLGDSSAAGGSASLLGGSFTIANPITLGTSAVGVLTIGNSGTTATTTFTGAVGLNGNNLTLSNSGTTGSTTLSGGITGTGSLTLGNTATGATAGALTLSTAAINNVGSITNNGIGAGATLISSVIGTNVTGVNQNSTTSQLLLTGANTYTSATAVNFGVLNLGTGGSLAGTSVTAAAGTVLLVNGTTNNTIGTSGGASVTIAGGTGTTGGTLSMVGGGLSTLNINSSVGGATVLTMAGASGNTSTLIMDIGGSSSDTITLGSGLLASIGAGGVNLNLNPSFSLIAGDRTLLTAPGGGLTAGGSQFTLGTNWGGAQLSLANTTGTALILSVTNVNATPLTAWFKGGLDANWNTFTGSGSNNSNWTALANGVADTNAMPGTTTAVHFSASNAITGNLTTSLNGATPSIASLTLDGNFTNAVTIAPGAVGPSGTLTIGSGGITVTGGGAGALTVSAPVILGAGQTWTNRGASALTVSGAISGSGNLVLNANSAGAIALGAGTVGVTVGTLSFAGSLTNSGTGTGVVTINGALSGVTSVVQNSATSQLTLTGASTAYTGGITIKSGTVSGTTVGSVFGTTGSTIIIGDSSGSANATLSVGFNGNYTANPISIAAGNTGVATITASAATPVLPGAVTLNSHSLQLLSTASAFTLSGGITSTGTGGNLILNANGAGVITISTGSINMVGSITNSGTGAAVNAISSVIGTNVTGVIQDSATSQLTLSGANTFTSGITIKRGILSGATAAGSLGGTGNVITLGNAGASDNATLQYQSSVTYNNNPVTVAAANIAAVLTIAGSTSTGTVVVPGAITLNHDLVIAAGAVGATTGTINFSGGVTGTGNLIINYGGTNVTGGVTFSGATLNFTGAITNVGSNTTAASVNTTTISSVIGTNVTSLTENSFSSALTLTGTNTFTGATTINQGTINLNGTAGKLASTSIVVTGGGTFNSGDATAANANGVVNRLSTSATLTLGGANGGGNFNLLRGSSTTATQSLTSLTLNAGISSISGGATATQTATTLTFSGATPYVRSTGSILNIVNANTSVVFTNAPSGAGNVSGSILVGGILNSNDFINAASGAVAAATYTAATWASGNNTQVTAANAQSGATTGSLTLAGTTLANATVTLTGANTIQSGGILVQTAAALGAAISGGSITAASGQDFWIYLNGRALAISSNILNSSGTGLTLGGSGTLTLTGANTYAGTTTIGNGTTLLLNSAGTSVAGNIILGNKGTANLTLGASNQIADTSVISFNSGVNASGSVFALATFSETVAGIQTNTSAAGTASSITGTGGTLSVAGAGTYVYDGGISGTMGLTVGTGAATNLTLTNTAGIASMNYSGTTTIGSGATLTLIDSGNAATITSFASAITNNGTLVLTNSSAATSVTFAKVISGAGAIIINAGTSTIVLNQANLFSGGLTIKSGVLSGTTSLSAFGTSASTITIGDSSGSANATLSFGLTGAWTANPIVIAGGNTGTATITASTATPTSAGAITLNNHDLQLLATASNMTLSGGITGTGNVFLNSNGAGTVTLSTGALAYTGNLTIGGTSSSASQQTVSGAVNIVGVISNNVVGTVSTVGTTISGIIGASVLGVIQNSSTSPLTLSGANTFGTGLKINNGIVIAGVSNSTTVSGAAGPSGYAISLGATGGSNSASLLAGSFTVSNPVNLGTTSGTLTIGNSGTTAAAIFSGLISLNGHDLVVAAGNPTLGTTGTTTVTGSITGTGNLILVNNNTGTTAGGITLSAPSLNNIGSITNAGVGAGAVTISSLIGSNVTGIIQSSSTSQLNLTAANNYTVATSVTNGVLALGGTGSLGGTAISVGTGGTLMSTGTANTIGTSGSPTITIAGAAVGAGGTLSLISGGINILNINSVTSGATVLTMGGAAGNAANLNMEINGATSDTINLGAGLLTSIGAGGINLNLVALGALTTGARTLLTTPGGGLLAGGSQFTLGGNWGGAQLNLASTTTTSLILNVTSVNAAPTTAYFKGGIDNNWNTFTGGAANNSNWFSDAAGTTDANQMPGSTTDVHFYTTNATLNNLATSLNGAQITIKSLTLDGGALSNNVSIAPGLGGTLTITPASSSTGITVNNGSGTLTISAPVVVGAAQTWTNNSASLITVSGAVSGSGNLVLNANSSAGITISGATNFSGSITNSGSGAGITTISGIIGTNVTGVVQNSATSQLNLSGVNTFNSGLTIKAGTVLALTSSSSLGASTNTITLGDTSGSANASLLFGTNSLTFAAPIVLATGTTGTLTVGMTAASVGTVLTGGVTGNNNLTIVNGTNGSTGRPDFQGLVNNAGTITLIGTNSATTAATTFTGGIGSNVTQVSLSSQYAPLTINGGLAVNSGGTTLINNTTGTVAFLVSGVVSGTGGLILYNNSVSGGTMTLTGANTNFAGGITVKAGTVNVTTSAGVLGTGTLTLGDSAGGAVAASLLVGTTGFTFANAISLASNTTGTLTLGTSGTTISSIFTGGVTGSNNLTINSNGTSGTITFSTNALNNAGTITNTGAGTGATTISSVIGANVTGVIQNSATAALILSGANTYAGATTVTAGLLSIGNSAALGTTAGGTTVASGAALELQGNITVGAEALTISGTGVSANGALRNLSGTNNFGGLLTLGATASIQSDAGTLNLTNNGTMVGGGFGLTLAGAGSGSLSSIINTSVSSVSKSGGGTWTLNGVNTYTGATTISGGTLALGSASSLAGTAVSVAAGATLLVNGTSTIGTSGSASVVVAGGTGATGGALSLVSGGINTLTINSATSGATVLTLGGAASNPGNLNVEISGATADTITLGAGLLTSIGAGGVNLNITSLGALTTGNRTLLTSPGGGLTAGGGQFTLGGNWGGALLNLSSTTTTALILNVTAVNPTPATAYFKGGIDAKWNTFTGGSANNSNWTTLASGLVDTTQMPGATTDVHFYTTNATVANLATSLNGAQVIIKTLTLDGGALTNAVSISPGSGGTLTITPASATTGITLATGATSLSISAPLILGANQQWTVTDAAASLNVSGAVSETGGARTLATSGAGTVFLSGANSYTGATTVSATGVLNIQNNTALGTTAAGTTVASGGALQLQGGITVGAEALSLNGSGISTTGALRNISGSNVWQGTVTLAGATRINADAGSSLTLNTAANSITGTQNLTLGGAGNGFIVGTITTSTGTLTKDGIGTWTLSGANTYTGAITINAGALNVQNATGLGTAVGGVTVKATGTLELQGSITVGAEALTLTGFGLANGGALRSVGGTNIYGGLVTLATAASRINADSGSSLTLSNTGNITGTFGLTVGGAGSTTIKSVIATSTGTLTKDGSGTLTLSGTAVNTYTGATFVNRGTLIIDFANIATATNIINSGSALNLGGGTLSVLGKASAATSQSFASTTLTAGTYSVVSATKGTATSLAVDLKALTRNANSGLNFDLSGGPTVTLTGTTTTNGILTGGTGGPAYATFNQTDWATISGTSPVALASGSYVTDFATATAVDNENITQASTTAPTAFSVNTLKFNAGGAQTLTLAGANILNAGGILIGSGSGAVTIGGTGTLTGLANTSAANGELGIFQNSSSAATISAAIVNNAMGSSYAAATPFGTTFNKYGAGTLILTSTKSAWTGGTNIGAGVLQLGAANVIPDGVGYPGLLSIAAGGALDLNGFTETINGLSGSGIVDNTSASAVTLFEGNGTLAGSVTSTFSGTIQNSGGGALSLVKVGSGSLTLTGINTYTGSTTINQGSIVLNSTATGAVLFNMLPVTALTLGSGTLSVTGSTTAAYQSFSSTTLTGGATVSTTGTTPNVTLNLGAITRNAGAGLSVLLGTSPTGLTTTTTANTGGTILGGWAVTGATAPTSWAVSAGNGTTAGAITALSTYLTTATAGNTAANYLTTSDVDVTNSPTILAGITINSLRFNTSGASTLTLTGTNIINSGGILVTVTVGSNNQVITGGTLVGSASGELIINNFNTSTNKTITINSLIANNGGATGLTINGPGTVALGTSTNTYTGNTVINGGTLTVDSNVRISTNSTIVLNGGQFIMTGNNQTLSSALTLGAAGGTISYGSSSNNYTFAMGGTGATVGQLGVGSRTLTLTETGATGRVAIFQPKLTDPTAGVTSLIINGAADGDVWRLDGVSSYTGFTMINRGVLRLNAAGLIYGSNGLLSTATTGTIIFAATGTNRAILETNTAAGTITRSVGYNAGQIHWEGNGGFSNSAVGTVAVNLGGAGAQLTWGVGGFVPTGTTFAAGGNYLEFGQATGNGNQSLGTIDFQNAIALGGLARTVLVEGVNVGVANAIIPAVISGVLSSTAGGGLIKTGQGILELTGSNAATTIGATIQFAAQSATTNAGALVFGSTSAILGSGANISFLTNSLVASTVTNGAVGVVGDTNPIATLGARIANASTSTGAFLLGADSSAALDFSSYPNMRLAGFAFTNTAGVITNPAHAVNYTGTITPAASTYRFGGLFINATTTAPAAALVIGSRLSGANSVDITFGNTNFTHTNTYSGATTFNGNNVGANVLVGIGSDAAFGSGAVTLAGANTWYTATINGDHSVSNNIFIAGSSTGSWDPAGSDASNGALNNQNEGNLTFLGTIDLGSRNNMTLTGRGGKSMLVLGDFTNVTQGFTYAQSATGYFSFLSTAANGGIAKNYTGNTIVSANGIFVIDSNSSLGGVSGLLSLGSGTSAGTETLQIQPGTTSVDLGARAILIAGGSSTVAVTPNFNVPTGSTLIVGGTITNTNGVAGLIKSGLGTMKLTGQSPNATASGTLQINAGTLVLDAATAGGTVWGAAGQALILGIPNVGATGGGFGNGGTLQITGTYAQSFGAVTVNARANTINLTDNMTLTLGAITRTTGSSLNFVVPTGSVAYTTAGIAGLVNGATTWNGNDWAAANGTTISQYSAYTTPVGANQAIVSSATSNLQIDGTSSGNLTLGLAVTDLNTLKFKDTNARTIDLSAGVLRLGAGSGTGGVTSAGGILVTSGAGALTIGTAANVGTLTVGANTGTTTSGDLVFINNSSSDVTVNAVITDNFTGTTHVTTVANSGSGSGLVVLAGNNTFTGALIINSGTISVNQVNNGVDGGPLGMATAAVGNILLNGGTFRANLSANGATDRGFTLSAPSTIEVVANTLTINSTLNGPATANAQVQALNAGILKKTGAGTLELKDLATNATNAGVSIEVAQGTLLLSKTTTAVISAVDLAGGAGLIIDSVASGSAATVKISGTGGNQISDGSSVVVKGDNTVKGVLDLNGFNETIDGLAGTGIVKTGVAGTSTLTLGGNNNASNAAYTLGAAAAGVNSTGLNNFGGTIQDGAGTVAVTKIGSGIQIFSAAQDYSGNTTISAGTLKLNIANALPSGAGKGDVYIAGDQAGTNVGALANTMSDKVISAGTLDMGGFDQIINGLNSTTGGFVTNNPTLAWNGSTWDVALANQGAKTLTLGNANANGSFNGIIEDGFTVAPGVTSSAYFGTINLVKTGSGTQTLSGANTYGGSTAIQNGTVIVSGGANRLPTGTTVTLGSGSNSGLLQIGDGTGAISQQIAGLNTSGSGSTNAVVGGNSSNSTLVLNQTGASTYSGALGGADTYQNNLNFTLQGGGTLTLNNVANTLAGTTTVRQGSTLILNSDLQNSQVSLGGTGGGTMIGNVTLGGLLTVNSGGVAAPGNSAAADVATLTLHGGLTLNTGGTLALQIGSTPTLSTPLVHDLINITGGAFTINGGQISLTDLGGSSAVLLGTYNLIDYSGASDSNNPD